MYVRIFPLNDTETGVVAQTSLMLMQHIIESDRGPFDVREFTRGDKHGIDVFDREGHRIRYACCRVE